MNYLGIETQLTIAKGANHLQYPVFFAQSGAYAHTPESNMLKKYVDMYDSFKCVKMTQTFWLQNTDNLTSAANDQIMTLHSCYDGKMKGRNVNNLREIIASPKYKRTIMRPFKRYSFSVYPQWPQQSSFDITRLGQPRDTPEQVYFNENALAGMNPFKDLDENTISGIRTNKAGGGPTVTTQLEPPSENGHHLYIELPADQKAKQPINLSYTYAYVFEFKGLKQDTMEYV